MKNINEELEKVLQAFIGKKVKPKAGAGPTTPVISEAVCLSADAATNSLIIMADRADYQILKEIIEKLDIPRSMVFIECLIAEVNVNNSLDLGIEWMATGEGSYEDKVGGYGGGFGGGSDSGYANLGRTLASAAMGMGSFPAGFSMGAFGETITMGGLTFPTMGAMLQALKKEKDIHILSTPQILTTDNKEAIITIGKNIPYLTKVGTTSTTETYSNYEYKDVGISLKIKPQINENRLIRLDISQEVTRLDIGSTVSAERPATLKRTIDTNVIVHDGHTIVIGGLIDDSLSEVEYKVPCLGDIPGLGWLFKSISNSKEKTNLFVFLTPHVIKSVQEADSLRQEKQDKMESVQEGTINLYPPPPPPDIAPQSEPAAMVPQPEPEPAADIATEPAVTNAAVPVTDLAAPETETVIDIPPESESVPESEPEPEPAVRLEPEPANPDKKSSLESDEQ